MLDSIQIEKYELSEKDMIVAAMVKGYLSTKPEVLCEIVKTQGGSQYRIDGSKLATLIDHAKIAAATSAREYKAQDSDDTFKAAVAFIREETLPRLCGKQYVETMPVAFAEFITDCWREAQ